MIELGTYCAIVTLKFFPQGRAPHEDFERFTIEVRDLYMSEIDLTNRVLSHAFNKIVDKAIDRDGDSQSLYIARWVPIFVSIKPN